MKKITETSIRLKEMGAWLTLILFGLGVVLIILEFVIHRHGETKLEDIPLFPAFYGFGAFVLVVIGGIILRKIIMRSEDYYGDN